MSEASAVAEILDGARLARKPLEPGDFSHDLDLAEAYRAQHVGMALRLQRGEAAVGLKLGFTSKAKMRQMGVDSVIAGQLTDLMWIAEGGTLDLADFIHPRVELEVAFRLGSDVDFSAPNCDIADHIDAVAPALEIIDSRFAGFGFDLGKVIADNTSAAAFVIGPWLTWDGRNLSNLAAELTAPGQAVQVSSTAAIMGEPLRALTELRRLARDHQLVLRAGDIVLAGAATEAVALGEGTVEGRIAQLGRVVFQVKRSEKGSAL